MTNKFYEKTWFIVLMAFIFPPAAIILMWIKKGKLENIIKLLLTAVLGVWSFIWGIFAIAFLLVITGNTETTEITTGTPTEIISSTEITTSVISGNTIHKPENSTEPQTIKTEMSTTKEVTTKETNTTTTSVTSQSSQKPSSSQTITKPNTTVTPTKPVTTEKVTTPPTTTEKETEEVQETYYVLNTSTQKFHIPTCRDVKKIKPENYEECYKSRDDIIADNYSPCGHCHP